MSAISEGLLEEAKFSIRALFWMLYVINAKVVSVRPALSVRFPSELGPKSESLIFSGRLG